MAAFFSVVKPFLQLPKKIKGFEETLTSYRILRNDLDEIKLEVSQGKVYDDSLKNKFRKARKRKAQIALSEPLGKEDKKIKEKCTKEVLIEYPNENFYIPEEEP